ncbi:hypothetical protein ACLX1H_002331 [Fusarium chlamydosporum]
MLPRMVSLFRSALCLVILAHDVLKLRPKRFDRREFVANLHDPISLNAQHAAKETAIRTA